jgi:AcrR family transcriptional regulator
MARPKEFERDTALDDAIAIFCDHGYEGTSTEVLLGKMGIGRQSLYDTFGDKRRLYLEALQRYAEGNVASQIAALNVPFSLACSKRHRYWPPRLNEACALTKRPPVRDVSYQPSRQTPSTSCPTTIVLCSRPSGRLRRHALLHRRRLTKGCLRA